MGSAKTAFQALLISLMLPIVGVNLITAFATGATAGETLILSVGPLVLWLLPLVAVINIIGRFFTAGDGG